MKDGMEQERSWRQGGIHNRSVKKGEVPELGQWWTGKKMRDVLDLAAGLMEGLSEKREI